MTARLCVRDTCIHDNFVNLRRKGAGIKYGVCDGTSTSVVVIEVVKLKKRSRVCQCGPL